MFYRLACVLLTAALTSCVFGYRDSYHADAAATNCNTTPTNLSDPNTALMWAQINNARTAWAGAKPLQWSDTLAVSAAWMAFDASRRPGNGDPTFPSLIDSLGRDTRSRLTDCGYRPDAGVGSSIVKVTTDSVQGAFTIWGPYNNLQLYRVIHDLTGAGTFQVAALGRATNPMSFYPYFWALDVGTLPEMAGPTSTPAPPTQTLIPTPISPTLTPIPTVMATPTPAFVRENCYARGPLPGPFRLECD